MRKEQIVMGNRVSRVSKKYEWNRFLFYLLVILVLFVIYVPIFLLILFSFNEGRFQVFPITGYSLKWYIQMFSDPSFVRSLANSLMLAGATSITATIVGFFGAYSALRSNARIKGLFSNSMLLPLTIPYILLGVALRIYFFNLKVPLSLFTVYLGHLTFTIPLAFLTIRARIAQIPVTYEEAAWDLGASRLVTLKEIILPLSFPGIIASVLLTFTFAFDEFVIAYFLTRFEMTLPIKIWSTLITGFDPRVNAVGTMVFLITLVTVTFAQKNAFKQTE